MDPADHPGATGRPPRGRDQVRAAVLEATRALVAESGPDGFSVREIAARAGVNHALVHRHFGTKADVLEQVLLEEGRLLVSEIGELPDAGDVTPEAVARVLDVMARRPTYWRALVDAVLAAPGAAGPGTAVTTDLFGDLWRGRAPARAVDSAVAGSLVLGWLIFAEFMAGTTGADTHDVRDAVAASVAALLAETTATDAG